MAGKQSKKTVAACSGFVALLADVKQRVQTAQRRVILCVNAELAHLYWILVG